MQQVIENDYDMHTMLDIENNNNESDETGAVIIQVYLEGNISSGLTMW